MNRIMLILGFWGPERAPFTYMTSKWGRESSCEVLSDSDNSSYQTPSVVGSLHSELAILVRGNPRVGETTPVTMVPSPSAPLSQQQGPASGEPTRMLKHQDHWGWKSLVKVSWTHSSEDLRETGSIGLLKRKVRSLSPSEYASDALKEEREGSPNHPM